MAASSIRGLRIFQIVLWTLVVVLGAYIVLPSVLPRSGPPGVDVTPPEARLGPDVAMNAPFQLVTHEGKPVTEKDFAGKPGAWFYGFTNCPDICPTALAEMTQLLADLGADGGKLNAVFVTVDPERDTAEILKTYMGYFDPRIIGLTGDLPAITEMAKSRFVQFAKLPQGETYAMQHPAGFFLVDAEGNFAGTLDPEESLEVKLGKLKKLIGA